MSIKVQFMKPFYSKVTGSTLRLVFAYQYLSIIKDDELYAFVPVEGKEIHFNLESQQVENLSDVFVFQRGNRFIRMPIYQLMLVCAGFEENIKKNTENVTPNGSTEATSLEIENLFKSLEDFNIDHAINLALDERDFETCRKLVALCK